MNSLQSDLAGTDLCRNPPEILEDLAKSYNSTHAPLIPFPVAWKEALVLPLLKKPGLDILFKNFRPVSNLPFVSRLTESAVYNQTHSHICMNNLYPANQSSYRKNYSTETALLRVKNDMLNVNKQHAALLVLKDLSAAFDTMDHNVLLSRLDSKFGITVTALE